MVRIPSWANRVCRRQVYGDRHAHLAKADPANYPVFSHILSSTG